MTGNPAHRHKEQDMTEATPTPLADGGDPGDFNVDQVNDYLATLAPDSDERAYVLELERNGQARVGILGKADANGNRPTDPMPELVAGSPNVEQDEATQALGSETVDLVLLQHWTDSDGKAHRPGATVSTSAAEALVLLTAKWAIRAEDAKQD